jgi:hypothetical protein
VGNMITLMLLIYLKITDLLFLHASLFTLLLVDISGVVLRKINIFQIQYGKQITGNSTI